MKSKTIKEAAARCRAAWKKHPNAKLAWCCHHRERIEMLTSPAEDRIKYILRDKPKHEQIVRLDNFRPVLAPQLRGVRTLAASIAGLRAESTRLTEAAEKLEQKASALQDKALKVRRFVLSILRDLKHRANIKGSALDRAHKRDVPGNDWDDKQGEVKGTGYHSAFRPPFSAPTFGHSY